MLKKLSSLVVGGHGISIPSVFVAGSTGAMLGQFDKDTKYVLPRYVQFSSSHIVLCILLYLWMCMQ